MQQDINPPAPSGLSFLTALRMASGFGASVATLGLAWLLYIQTGHVGGIELIEALIDVVPAVIAIICWWVAFRIHIPKSQKRMKYTAVGGGLLGFIGFIGGFIGPILLDPTTAQGPLVGIFFTGPLGLLVGAVGGYIYALIRGQESVSR